MRRFLRKEKIEYRVSLRYVQDRGCKNEQCTAYSATLTCKMRKKKEEKKEGDATEKCLHSRA